jgi:acyl dehydratase
MTTGPTEAPQQLAPTTYRVTRADLVAYAEASGDPNPIHQDEAVALSVGLPGVIAHGMFTLALAARYVDEWVGEPGTVVELGAKFTRPVVVPAGAEGASVTVQGVVAEKDGRRTVSMTVTCEGQKVLGNPKAVLRA